MSVQVSPSIVTETENWGLAVCTLPHLHTRSPGYRQLKDGSIEIDVSKAKSALTVCGLYETTAFHQAAIPDEMDSELCEKLKGLRRGADVRDFASWENDNADI